jgi:predicted ArsR family transcriptional regulator
MTTAYFYTYNAIFDAKVSGNARIVYAYLCKCANRDGKSYPSHKAIAAACGIGVTTVKKSLAELESAELVAVRGQARPDKGRRGSLYTVVKTAVKGFFMTYANIFVTKLTAKAKLVYLYLCRLASGNNLAFPAHKTTANACGLSVAGARTAIDELESAGLVERTAQYRDNGGQRSNLYTLVTEPEHGGNCDEQDNEPVCADITVTPENIALDNNAEPPVGTNEQQVVAPVSETVSLKSKILNTVAAIFRRKTHKKSGKSRTNCSHSRHKAPGIVAGKHPPLLLDG